MDRGDDFMIIKPLAKYSESFPDVAMDCLQMIVFAEEEAPYWWGLDNQIKQILWNAKNSDGEKAKVQAEEVQDQLLKLGRFQFKNLDGHSAEDKPVI